MSDNGPPDTGILGRWTGWVGAALTAWIPGLLRSNWHPQCASPIRPAPNYSASSPEVLEFKSVEKLYRINDGGRVLKRSLRLDECYCRSDGKPAVAPLVVERLQNEAACMTFIRENTDIPVPKVLEAYLEEGVYWLWMEFVEGVAMSELTPEEKFEVIPQGPHLLSSLSECHGRGILTGGAVERVIMALQRLRSRFSGGPTDILAPTTVVEQLAEWKPRCCSPNEEFVFCHGDLQQDNILVDPRTLRIVAVIDWEYGGFFPREHEIPFYEVSESSGAQLNSDRLRSAVNNMIEFWRQSEVFAS